jgi:large subunit ribosomal protein L23
MTYSCEFIKALMRTEKSATQETQGKYLFLVDNNANKIQIKRAVEELYKVKVHSVNTIMRKGKAKRVRYHVGMTPDTKHAVVTLVKGQSIQTAG